MNKKAISALLLLLTMAITTIIGFKALESLSDLDFNDPFETDFGSDD